LRGQRRADRASAVTDKAIAAERVSFMADTFL
jgi:hypothetical protein